MNDLLVNNKCQIGVQYLRKHREWFILFTVEEFKEFCKVNKLKVKEIK